MEILILCEKFTLFSISQLLVCKSKNINDNWQKDLLTLSCKYAFNSGTNILFLNAATH